MPTPTYTPLATVTLGSSASSVTFSSIPATYRDLVLVVDGAATGGVNGAIIRLNGDTGSNYTGVDAQGNGSSTGSGTSSGTSAEIGVAGTNRFVITSQFMDYSATDKHKTFLSRHSSAGDRVRMTASRYASTSAITTVLFSITGSTYKAGTTVSLYGIVG